MNRTGLIIVRMANLSKENTDRREKTTENPFFVCPIPANRIKNQINSKDESHRL